MCVAASRCLEIRDGAGVLPVGQRQIGVGLETTRSFAHAEMELKIRDAHARIGGVHSMGQVAKTGGDPLGTSTACPIWGP